MKESITIYLAENDDQGEPCGKVSGINFFIANECAAFLEIPWIGQQEQIITTPRTIEIYGIIIRTFARGTWSGNMKWNSYETLPEFALGLINVLMRSNKWVLTGGWSDIDKKWSAKADITYSDFDLVTPVRDMVIDPKQTSMIFPAGKKAIYAMPSRFLGKSNS